MAFASPPTFLKIGLDPFGYPIGIFFVDILAHGTVEFA
jgi:hypothetical protein